ncbi:MAG: DUF2087 domain-containing protein [Fimbriimonadaceae bacterium]|nr:DUF2087 domain-containing protein [Fimbriimonadaceae bacterium]
MPADLRGYFNQRGILLLWPAQGRADKRRIALEWIASHFEGGRSYREVEVNALLKELHAFDDHAFLRRELVDRGYLMRNKDGTDYRLNLSAPQDSGG